MAFKMTEYGENLLQKWNDLVQPDIDKGVFNGTSAYEDKIKTLQDAAGWCLLTYGDNALSTVVDEWIEYDHADKVWGFDVYEVKAELEKCLVDEREVDLFALAVKLNDFYKDYDFYDYMDSVDGAQTEEDLIEGLVEMFAYPAAVDGVLETLNDIKEHGELDEEQFKVMDELVDEVTKVRSFLEPSLDEKLSEAQGRSEETSSKEVIEPDKFFE